MRRAAILLAVLMAFCMISRTVQADEKKSAETSAYCGATKETPSVTTKGGQPCEVQNIKGKVDSITPANPAATDKRPVITVIDDKGKRTAFAVNPDTALCGVDMSPITLDSIKEGTPVKVKVLCAKEGEGVAMSITLVP